MTVGDTLKLKVSGVSSAKVTWKTTNEAVATVTRRGYVAARGAGSVTITAKVKKKTLKCRVTVKARADTNEDVKINPLDEVKAYIRTKGGVNSSGDRVISENIDGCQFGVVYLQSKDALEFVYTEVTDDGDKIGARIELPSDMRGQASMQQAVVSELYGWMAAGSFITSSITKNGAVTFALSDTYGAVPETSAQKISNNNLQITLMGCGIVLLDKTGYSLKDIGFSSYQ